MRVEFRDTGASVALDALRGLAALLVVFDHCHHLFFVEPGPGASWGLRALYAAASAGPEAVAIFFVLSGYLVSGSVFRSLARGTWRWRDYLTHRLVRLWLVLLPALVLGVAWDAARLAASGPGWVGRLAGAGIRPGVFLGNVFFLQAIHVPVLGSNRVLWSLAFEFWYYLLFPLGLMAVRRGQTGPRRVLYAVGFLVAAAIAGRAALGLFPVWLMGTALALLPVRRSSAALRWVASMVYAPCVVWLASFVWPWHHFKMDYVLGVLTAALLWVMLGRQTRVTTDWAARGWRTLAGISYSMYLVHYPLLAFLAAVALHGGAWLPVWSRLLESAGLVGAVVVYAYVVAAGTEFHTDRVRRWVQENTRRLQ